MDSVNHTSQSRGRLIWALTRKEILTVVKHPHHLISLAIPIFISLVFQLLFPALQTSNEIVVAVYAPEKSSLLTQLERSGELTIVRVESETAVTDAVTDDAVAGLILLPELETAVSNNQSPPLIAYLNDDARTSHKAIARASLSDALLQMQTTPPPVQLSWETRNLVNDTTVDISVNDYLFITLAILSISMLGKVLIPQTLAEEKENYSLSALLASPATMSDILMAKAISSIGFAILLALIITTMNDGWRGDWPITAVSLLLGIFLFTGVGMILGLAGQKKQQLQAISGILILFFNIPSWFAQTAVSQLAPATAMTLKLIPTYYLVDALRHSVTGSGNQVGLDLIVLMGWIIAVIGVVVWMVRKRPFWKGGRP